VPDLQRTRDMRTLTTKREKRRDIDRAKISASQYEHGTQSQSTERIEKERKRVPAEKLNENQRPRQIRNTFGQLQSAPPTPSKAKHL